MPISRTRSVNEELAAGRSAGEQRYYSEKRFSKREANDFAAYGIETVLRKKEYARQKLEKISSKNIFKKLKNVFSGDN